MSIQRKFIPGEEWIYYKIYSGPKFLDELLRKEIYNSALHFANEKIIDKFFFVRYVDDEGYHLRVRFHLLKSNDVDPVMTTFARQIKPYVQEKMIWKVVLDSYNREIERYTEELIDVVEDIFTISSWQIFKDLEILSQNNQLSERWSRGIIFVETILNKLNFSLEEKKTLYTNYYEGYKSEFDPQGQMKTFLNTKFRENKSTIERILLELNQHNENEKADFLESKIAVISNYFEGNNTLISKEFLLHGIFHMHFNRLFLTKARMNEFVVYYLLRTFYNSAIVRDKLDTQSRSAYA